MSYWSVEEEEEGDKEKGILHYGVKMNNLKEHYFNICDSIHSWKVVSLVYLIPLSKNHQI